MAKKPKATKAARRAVKRVIFEPTRLRALVDDLYSIDTLMGLHYDGQGDPFSPFLLINGDRNPNIFLVTERCRRVATTYRSIRAEIRSLDLPPAAKRQIQLGFAEEAAAWDARAVVWEAAGGGDPNADPETIGVHMQAAVAAYSSARAYMPTGDEYADRLAAARS